MATNAHIKNRAAAQVAHSMCPKSTLNRSVFIAAALELKTTASTDGLFPRYQSGGIFGHSPEQVGSLCRGLKKCGFRMMVGIDR